MSKRNVSEIETGAGFFMGFVNALMDVTREKAVPFAAIYRLATPGGRTTLGNMVDLACADWQSEQPKPVDQVQGGHPYRSGGDANALPPNHYRVLVNRGPLPPMTTLEKQFSKDGVSELFNGKYGWKKHSSRTGANDMTAEEVVMVVKHFDRAISSEEAIAWGLENGLVPADEKETYAFGINPETCDLQRELWLVGLGSFTMSGGNQYVAMLRSHSGGRILGHDWLGNRWGASYRFLFVRK